jgi:4-amino-4-deoxy-L-arabinose transferase-like glycosyltransferase
MSIRYSIKKIYMGTLQILSKPWMQYLWLFLITLLAAALRFYKLGEWSFWIDEIFTINHAIAHFSTSALLIDHIPPSRNWFPISIILTAQSLNIWEVSEWSARLSSAFIGVLSIPILYLPLKRIFGSWLALIAMTLLAVSPWHIFWSQNARFYIALFLFYSLALLSFYFAIERDKPKYFIVFYICLYLALSERLFTIFIIPVIGVYIFTLWAFRFERPAGLNLKNLSLLGVPILVGGMIELYSRIVIGESRFFADFNWFFLYRNDDPIRLLGNISFNIGVPLMVFALFSGISLVLRKDRAGLLMAANAIIPLVMLVMMNPFIFTKDRYIFMVLLSWIVLVAWGIQALLNKNKGINKWLVVSILILLLADAGSDLLLYYRVNHGNRGEWKTAFQIVQEKSDPDDIVAAFWPEFGPFYLDRQIVKYEDIDVPTIIENEDVYWFVLDAETIWANLEVKDFLENEAQLIDVHYLRTPDDFFLRVYRFDPEQALTP